MAAGEGRSGDPRHGFPAMPRRKPHGPQHGAGGIHPGRTESMPKWHAAERGDGFGEGGKDFRQLTMPIEKDILSISFPVFENIMTTTSKPDQLLLRFRPTDTQNGISRSTVEKLAEYLGFTGETQVIHYALRKLAKKVLPTYEADDGELTPTQLVAIRKAIPQGRAKSVKSSLF
ncbi:MAG: hypothetical protein ACYDDT_11775 [Sulfuricella sp.]